MRVICSLFLSLLLLSACGQGTPPPEVSPSPSPAMVSPIPTPEPPPSPEPEPPAAESPAPFLSGEEAEGARQAALDYYAGTVFQVQSLTQSQTPREGEVTFQVSCFKGGEEQPPRSISLERQGGVWMVLNEGY